MPKRDTRAADCEILARAFKLCWEDEYRPLPHLLIYPNGDGSTRVPFRGTPNPMPLLRQLTRLQLKALADVVRPLMPPRPMGRPRHSPWVSDHSEGGGYRKDSELIGHRKDCELITKIFVLMGAQENPNLFNACAAYVASRGSSAKGLDSTRKRFAAALTRVSRSLPPQPRASRALARVMRPIVDMVRRLEEGEILACHRRRLRGERTLQ